MRLLGPSSISLVSGRKTIVAGCLNLIRSLANPRRAHFKTASRAAAVSRRSSSFSSAMADVDAELLRSARSELLQMFEAGVLSVQPSNLVLNKVRLVEDSLEIGGRSYPLRENVHLVGFGKAVGGMAFALERLLGERLKGGVLSVPRLCLRQKPGRLGEQCLQQLLLQRRSAKVRWYEGAEDNRPDDAALEASRAIVELARGLTQRDTLLVLVSGGGSALLTMPRPPITLADKRRLCTKLQNAGASIAELNALRIQLSEVKGGGLARIAHPAQLITLVLSDVVGDPIEFIASGPTYPFVTGRFNDARDVLMKYHLYEYLDEDIKELLSDPDNKVTQNQTLMMDGKFLFVDDIIIGNNSTALHAAEEAAKRYDAESLILSSIVEGNVEDISFAYAKFTKSICCALEKKFPTLEDFTAEILSQDIGILKISRDKIEKAFKICTQLRKGKALLLLAGGEPTVVVSGNGKGGRNQELALRFSLDWLSEIAKEPMLAKYFVLFLSAGTDGQDGPTDATGAFGRATFRPKMMKILQDMLGEKNVTPKSILHILEHKLNQVNEMLPENVLKRNDSYSFFTKFENGRNLVKTGLTGTNVMDLHFIYLKLRDCKCDIESSTLENNSTENVCDFLFDEYSVDEDSNCTCALGDCTYMFT